MKKTLVSKTKVLATWLGAIVLGSAAHADVLKDFDTLGGNDVLLEKARALNPDAQVRIVQERVVSRRSRLEIAPEVGFVLGGDSYNRTQNVGANLTWHFVPEWSLGLRYAYSFNSLRPEGEYLLSDTSVEGKAKIPDIDWPKQQALAIINWYPVYGKMNLYDLGVVHFDIYAVAGGGTIELKSGQTPTYTAGGGIGMWFSQHLSTRFELRWQGYNAKRFKGEEAMNTTVGSVQIGYML